MSEIMIYPSDDLYCSNLGLGVLTGVTSCEVTRTLSNQWECVFSIAINSQHYNEIEFGKKVKIKADEKAGYQQFRIYKITKPDLKGIVKVYCEHVSYELSRLTVKPFEADNQSATAAISAILNNCSSQTHHFTGQASTVSGTKNLFSDIPRTARSWLLASDNSITKLYNCEIEFNNYIVTAKPQIGVDNGVRITYGKNLSKLSDDRNSDTAYNAIYPYAIVDEHYYELADKIIFLTNTLPFTEVRCIPVDLSNKFESGATITDAILRQTALTYAGQARLTKTNQNLKISFVQLWQTKEYETLAALERVGLGDTVYVYYAEYGVDVSARVNKIVYDALNDKYISIELGQARKTITETIAENKIDMQAAIDEAQKRQKTIAQQLIEEQTALITGNQGGHIIFTLDQDDKPQEMCIMDTDSKATAQKLWRFNLSGFGFSDTGYNGNYTYAMDMLGRINASMIVTGTLDASKVTVTNLDAGSITTGSISANKITSGVLADAAGNFTLNLSNGMIQMVSDNSGELVIWREGITMYHHDNSVATSMFLSTNDVGVLTAESVQVGIRDSERIHLYVNNNVGIIKTDRIVADSGNALQINSETTHSHKVTINNSLIVTGMATIGDGGTNVIRQKAVTSQNKTLYADHSHTGFTVYSDNYSSGYYTSILNDNDLILKHNTSVMVSIESTHSVVDNVDVYGGKINIPKGRIDVGNGGTGVAISTDTSGNSGHIYSNQVTIRNGNGLNMGGQSYGPVKISINGTNYTLIGQRNS